VKTGHLSALLVCDSSETLGSGHVMRQITLGNSLRSIGYQVRLCCAEIPEALSRRAREFDLDVEHRDYRQSDSGLADELLNATSVNDLVIFDGYYFTNECISKVYESSRRVVLIDDNGDLAEMPCHMILNQNLHSSEKMYERNLHRPHLLLGPNWALVRPEVVRVHETQNLDSRSGIFVAVGGTDPLGITKLLVEALSEQLGEKVLAAGGFLAGNSLTPQEMAVRMASSGVGVIACGTTTWEACCLGLPFVGLVVADNQLKVAESLDNYGFGESIDCRMPGWVDRTIKATRQLVQNESQRDLMSLNGRQLVDGLGADRVAAHILQLFSQ
jgi:UDP-2,4-diacetamido-2,4,6-trideoxy-beta-L-altropyranose hydrolase